MKSTNAANRYRAMRCAKALRRYDTDDDLPTCLTDCLADARHWCDRNRQSYAELDRRAYDHYCSEVAEAGKEKP
ncbi:MAG: hypothetical protein GC161_07700 [Planctomycetaceae bacterium]|nr:hypothetical protein [Planctomycetaceae bacterium]